MRGGLLALLLIASLLAAVAVLSGWHSSGEPAAAGPPPPPEANPPRPLAVEPPGADDLVAIALTQPLFSPTRQPVSTAGTDQAASTEAAPEFRLTGIVMEANRRLAIFAAAHAKPLAVEEGGQVYGWHVDSISPREVSMSGPAGTRKMQPKTDPALKGARPHATPAAVIPAPPPAFQPPPVQPQRQNAVPPGPAGSGPTRSPLAGGPPSPITFPMTSSSFPPTGAPRPRQ